MQWRDPEHERIQYSVNRLIRYSEFAKILETILGGDRLVEYLQRRIKIDPKRIGVKITPAPWSRKSHYEKSAISLLVTTKFLYDPAFDLGFPLLDEDGLLACKTLSKDFGEKAIGGIVEDFIRVADKKTGVYCGILNEMTLSDLDSHVDKIMQGVNNPEEDSARWESERWKTLWALVIDSRTTRLEFIKKLRFKTPEEVKKNFPYCEKIIRQKGIVEEQAEWDMELNMNLPKAKLDLLQFRAYFMGEMFTEGFIQQQIFADNLSELEMYGLKDRVLSQRMELLEGLSAESERTISELRTNAKKLEREKQELSDRVGSLSSDLSRAMTAIPAAEPVKMTREEREAVHLNEICEELRGTIADISGKYGEASREMKKISEESEQKSSTIRNYELLLGLVRIKDEIRNYFSSKRIAVVTRQQGVGRDYSSAFEKFGITPIIIDASDGKARDTLKDSKFDYFLITSAHSAHSDQDYIRKTQGNEKIILLPSLSLLSKVLAQNLPK